MPTYANELAGACGGSPASIDYVTTQAVSKTNPAGDTMAGAATKEEAGGAAAGAGGAEAEAGGAAAGAGGDGSAVASEGCAGAGWQVGQLAPKP